MIRVTNVVKYHGEARILDGASLEVRRGQVAALVGPSGGGKSTLLRCINGLEAFQEGEVAVGDSLKLTGGEARRVDGSACDDAAGLGDRALALERHNDRFQ
jgi:ABC-type polar amino acid transport system ATPase subunit